MRKRAVVASVLASLGILTVGWQIGAAASTSNVVAGGSTGTTTGGSPTGTATTAPSAPGSTPAASAPASSSPSSAPSAAPSKAASSGLKDGSFTGQSAQTPFGNVQVKVIVSGGKITDIKALQLTDQGGRSVQISNYAAPILRQEVLASQSANVANVNGATYTTDGYLTSVQSALDQAKA